MAVKLKHMAIVSEALERLQKATAKDVIRFTQLERAKVNQALAGLLKGHYVVKGELTGRGNENYWIYVKPYSAPKSNEKDWTEHYDIFKKIIQNGRIEETV